VESFISSDLELNDESKVAVIGGGPAGSFFTYFALDFAERIGIDIDIDIYEAKDFTCAGPSGCNHCGGIVSESLVQMLSTEGIVLPPNVIRKGIETYTLHLESGSTVIKTPLEEQRIAAVYRGFGPKGTHEDEQESFDNYLLNLCEQKGANVLIDKVISLDRTADGIFLKSLKSGEKQYDLVVGAAGLNPKTLALFNSVCHSYASPVTTKTYICEFYLDPEVVDEYFGNSMHVFLLNVPNIKFGALIPKGHYVTLVLLGNNINREVVKGFLDTQEVKACFPPDVDLNDIVPCFCFPTINIKGAKSAYADRVILIGDSSSSKLYKNGIGSAYITAKAAAKTAIFEGISEKDFKKSYQKVCDELNLDNAIGKGIFALTTIIQKSHLLKKGLYNMVVKEQGKDSKKRRMSSILWDTFTGSAPYKDILRRGIHPKLGSTLLWNTLKHSMNGTG
jgi:flavin-dependent dehydrogenase